jgi:hypothetical protein
MTNISAYSQSLDQQYQQQEKKKREIASTCLRYFQNAQYVYVEADGSDSDNQRYYVSKGVVVSAYMPKGFACKHTSHALGKSIPLGVDSCISTDMYKIEGEFLVRYISRKRNLKDKYPWLCIEGLTRQIIGRKR